MTDFTHIRELLAKATPGEWRYEDRAQHVIHDDEKGPMQVADIRGWGHLTGGGHGAWGMSPNEAAAIQDANGELITALRNNAEAMLDRIEKLEAENVRFAGQAMCEGERANEADAERDAMRAVVEAARIWARMRPTSGQLQHREDDLRKAIDALDSKAS